MLRATHQLSKLTLYNSTQAFYSSLGLLVDGYNAFGLLFLLRVLKLYKNVENHFEVSNLTLDKATPAFCSSLGLLMGGYNVSGLLFLLRMIRCPLPYS